MGYFSNAIDELADTLNFTLDLVAEEAEFGSFNRTTKSWNGAIRHVASGEADIGVSDFSMTNTRLDYVDFTVPIFATRNYLFIKQREIFAVKWFAYFKVRISLHTKSRIRLCSCLVVIYFRLVRL